MLFTLTRGCGKFSPWHELLILLILILIHSKFLWNEREYQEFNKKNQLWSLINTSNSSMIELFTLKTLFLTFTWKVVQLWKAKFLSTLFDLGNMRNFTLKFLQSSYNTEPYICFISYHELFTSPISSNNLRMPTTLRILCMNFSKCFKRKCNTGAIQIIQQYATIT